MLGVAVLIWFHLTLFYLVNYIAVLSVDLRDGSQVSQDPERLVELKLKKTSIDF